jgi:hypothetical protein
MSDQREKAIEAAHRAWIRGGAEADLQNARVAKAVREAKRVMGEGDEGAALIAAERRRQVDEEGWTPEHDDEHINGELTSAARCYSIVYTPKSPPPFGGYAWWPWEQRWWKPGNRIENLVKAGALIAAEIDRLKRRSDA